MGVHNEREMQEKRKAVRKAAERFAGLLLSDQLRDDDLLCHEIESLCQIVTEFKRG